jgi:UDP-MurNAc hydroxylase
MRITHLGHAGFFVETADCTVLCDPWHSDHLAFFDAWAVWPPNNRLDWKRYLRPTYLYVSHVHEDHFDRRLLARLPKDTPVLLPPFRFPVLREELARLGFGNFVDTPVRHGDTILEVFVSETPNRELEDSSLLAHDAAENFTFFDLNDSNLDGEQVADILDRYGPADVFTGQFSGASWFPAVYHYDHARKASLAAAHRTKTRDRFLEAATSLRAKTVVPASGPPLLVGSRARFNYAGPDGISAMPDAWQTDWPRPVCRVWPGDVVTAGRDRPTPPCGRGDYVLSKGADPTHAFFPEDLRAAGATFIDRVGQCLEAAPWLGELIPQKVVVHVPLWDTYHIDFRNRVVGTRSRHVIPDVPWFMVSVPPQVFLEVAHQDDWEHAFISHRCLMSREPDTYNEWVNAFFRNLDPGRLQAIGQSLGGVPAADTVLVGGYRVPARCPHRGVDLARFGRVDEAAGTFTCLGHGRRWKLCDGSPDGHCGEPLPVTKADSTG